MRITDLFGRPHSIRPLISEYDFTSLRSFCSQFLSDSDGHPLYKRLVPTYGNFSRVKIRYSPNKKQEAVIEAVDRAFKDKFGISDIHRRALFATSLIPTISEGDNLNNYYIFPVNGYQYLYNSEISTPENRKQTFTDLFENFSNEITSCQEVISQLVDYSYTNTNLVNGIERGSEIIIFNIPHYFAINTNTVRSYDELLTFIK